MAKSSEIEARRKQMLDDIMNSEEGITADELMKKYDIGTRTLKGDIKYFNDMGVNIGSRKGRYKLLSDAAAAETASAKSKSSANSDTDTELETSIVKADAGTDNKNTSGKGVAKKATFYQKSDSKVFRRMMVLMIMQDIKMSMSEKAIYDAYIHAAMNKVAPETIHDTIQDLINDNLLTVAETKYELVSNDLGYVEYYKLASGSPILQMLSEDEADEISDLILRHGKASPFAETLSDIEKKIMAALQPDFEADDEFDEAEEIENLGYISIGKKYVKSKNVKEMVDRLNTVPYNLFAIKVSYKTKNGVANYIVKVGLLMYAQDKDKLYVIGKRVNTNADNKTNEKDIIFKGENILEVERTDIRNDVYMNTYYMNMYDEMFSVSTEDPIDVEVEFDDFGQVKDKIYRLKETRKNAKVEVYPIPGTDPVKMKVVYKDRLRGLEDFANYLRKYGSSVKVIAPAELRDRMILSCERILKAYGVEYDTEAKDKTEDKKNGEE